MVVPIALIANVYNHRLIDPPCDNKRLTGSVEDDVTLSRLFGNKATANAAQPPNNTSGIKLPNNITIRIERTLYCNIEQTVGIISPYTNNVVGNACPIPDNGKSLNVVKQLDQFAIELPVESKAATDAKNMTVNKE